MENSNETALEKSEARKLIRRKRAEAGAGEKKSWDEAVFQKLTAHPLISGAASVYCYVSIDGETGTGAFLEWLLRSGKETAVPRVGNRDMDFFLIRTREDLAPGVMGILEPLEHCPRANRPEAPVIVPGVAFGQAGERCGYGGGYYDRFFEREPGHPRIAIAYDFQILPGLRLDSHDRRVDEIITPAHHYQCNTTFGRQAKEYCREELL